jgi:DNA-binding transcriptional ArsR family regulator
VPQQPGNVAAAKAELFKALAHPLRIRVLELLVDGERSVGDLAEALDVEISHLSQQLGVLRRAEVVLTRRVRTTVYYSLRDPRTAQLLVVARQLLVTGLRDSQSLLKNLEDEGRPART